MQRKRRPKNLRYAQFACAGSHFIFTSASTGAGLLSSIVELRHPLSDETKLLHHFKTLTITLTSSKRPKTKWGAFQLTSLSKILFHANFVNTGNSQGNQTSVRHSLQSVHAKRRSTQLGWENRRTHVRATWGLVHHVHNVKNLINPNNCIDHYIRMPIW